MKKRLIKLTIFCLCISLGIIACRKNKTQVENQSSNSSNGSIALTTYTNITDVEEQLKLIAKGYVHSFDGNTNLYSTVTNHLIPLDYLEDVHTNIQDIVLNSLTLDLETDIYNRVQSITGGQVYDRDMFYGFTYQGCDWVTGLRIVDTLDLSLPKRVTYDAQESDECWGYYLDNNNNLDSTWLTETNFLDYCILAVYVDEDCNTAFIEPDDPGQYEFCVNDCYCDPIFETQLDCPDCQPNNSNCPGPGLKLRMFWIRVNEDITPRDESWIQNRYEIAIEAAMNNLTGPDHSTMKMSANGNERSFLYMKFKRNEVPQIRRGRSRGDVTEKPFSNASSNTEFMRNYDNLNDDIFIRFYELDYSATPVKSDIEDCGSNPLNINTAFYSNQWWTVSKGGSFGTGTDPNCSGTNNLGIIHVPAGFTGWQAETIQGITYMTSIFTTPGLGEISVKLGFEL